MNLQIKCILRKNKLKFSKSVDKYGIVKIVYFFSANKV